jgi:hypothetical protein
MNKEERHEPRLIPTKAELPALSESDGELDTGNYIAQIANAWATVRRKPLERA